MQILYFVLDKILFPINRRKVINSQKQSVFGPPCIY